MNTVITAEIEAWLKSKLSGSAALAAFVGTRIYFNRVPASFVRPYVLYQYQAGVEESGIDGSIAETRAVYLVKVVSETEDYGPVAGAMHNAIQGQQGETTGAFIHSCVRQSPVSYPETVNGIQIVHVGGLYAIWAEEKS